MLSRLFGQGSTPPQGSDKVQIVDPATIRAWMDKDQVVLVDVRELDEHAAERIEGAINLPLSGFNPAELPSIPEGKRLVIHCRSGVRCGSATSLLLAAGYGGDIHRMQGGILGWAAAGGPTVRGK